MEAAKRELFEETGLHIASILSEAPLEESYEFRWQGQMIKKTVQYFACTVTGELVLQAEEIAKAKWLSLDAAEKQLTHSASKLLLSTSRNLLARQDQTASGPNPEQA